MAAIAGAPHVTNRGHLLEAMQVLEFASVVGLIRRTQALTGRVGIVAGVLGMFHRDRVLAVGGYDARMATEDIDLTWRLMLGGWHTGYEPRALVGMQVPSTMRGLWGQRKRWARGQGEVLHVHLGQASRARNHRMWLLTAESLFSLLWVVALLFSFVAGAIALITGHSSVFGFAPAWGVAIAVVATAQITLAVLLDHRYDQLSLRALLLAPIYLIAYWMLNAIAALRCQISALVRGPRQQRVVWDVERATLERVDDEARTAAEADYRDDRGA
jgi:biofilm PGA synthesis N-glycosyltransferase PgaC